MTDKTQQSAVTANGYSQHWWKQAAIYQIYPRSFKDSNGDGIGDLNGITGQLDYIQNLGIDVIWLSPIFKSPNADNGYDISDYRAIMDEFGTMADFERLLAGVKQRGMRLILDLVANHSSDEHAWFVESRMSKDNPYRDYYIWRPAKDGQAPNDWLSYFSGSAWQLDPATGEYYLHLFAVKQPDLNWDNPHLRQEIYDIMRFWLDKGIDGFRMDVIPFISKDPAFPDYPAGFDGDFGRVYASGPKLHDYIQEMHREVLSKYDVMTVGEAAGVSLEQTPLLVDERRKELNMIFQFDLVGLDRAGAFWKYRPFELPQLKAIFTRYEKSLDHHCWPTVFLSNHDNPRPVSRFGNDDPVFREPSAKMLATLLLTMKGTPFIYQGDELGMTNYPFTDIKEFDDIQVRNAWQEEVVLNNGDPADFMYHMLHTTRDHSRTCMQWDDAPNAGFSTAEKTWFVVNPNFKTINAKRAIADTNSVYHYYRQLLALRKQTPALIYGGFADIDPAHAQVFAYTRTLGEARYLVVLHFGSEPLSYTLPKGIQTGQWIFGNYAPADEQSTTLSLHPYEARIYAL
jgi:oligo-1,6-glucosidase